MFFPPVFIATLWTFFTYSLVRFSFLLWNWKLYQKQETSDLIWAFVYGWRFDLSAVATLSLFFILWAILLDLWQRYSKKYWQNSPRLENWVLSFSMGLFLAVHVLMLLFNFIDTELINFVGRRFTIDAISQLLEVPGKAQSYVLYAWPLALMFLATISCYGFVVRRLYRKKIEINWLRQALGYWSLRLSLLLLLLVAARGGLQSKPISFAHAKSFASPSMNSLVLNSSFTLIQTLLRDSLPREIYFQNSSEMLKHLNGSLKGPSWVEGKRFSTKQNIVLIVLESFALEYMGLPNDGQGFTPFLDELAKKGMLFSNAFASGRRSIEGIGAIIAGVPALMSQPFISSQFQTNYFLGMGTRLEKVGYHTSFFHGAKNGSMYFDQFMKSAGVKEYYGLNEYPNKDDSDGTWGIWDEPMFQWMLTKLNHFPRPFFSSVFSLSSHHPFRVPDIYKSKLPTGKLDILQSIAYTDFALRRFFAEAQKMDWYENTLFIITADHTSQSFRPEYQNAVGKYRGPLILFHPRLSFSNVDSTQVVSHIDILPTVLDFLGLPEKEKNYLGQSVFFQGDRSAVNYIDGRYFLFTKDYFLQYLRGGDYQMYSMKDPGQKLPLQQPAAKKQELVDRLKASIQYFSQGLWDNKLYYPLGP